MRCSACKQPLDMGDSLEVVCVTDSFAEVAFACDACGAAFSAWLNHNGAWSDSDANPVNLEVAGRRSA